MGCGILNSDPGEVALMAQSWADGRALAEDAQ